MGEEVTVGYEYKMWIWEAGFFFAVAAGVNTSGIELS